MVAFSGLNSSDIQIDIKEELDSSEDESLVTHASLGAIASSSPQIAQAQAENHPGLLERNIQTASEISDHVNKTVLVIVNYLDRDARVSEMLKGTGLSLKDAYKQLNDEYSLSLESYAEKHLVDFLVLNPISSGNRSNSSKIKEIKKMAAFSQEFRSGTCLEMAAIGFTHCIMLQIPVEYFLSEPRSHAFLVLGRDAESKPGDFRTWGSRAVVCDPWANKVYPASEISQRMKIFTGTKKTKDSIKTQFEDFSLQKYSTALIAQSHE